MKKRFLPTFFFTLLSLAAVGLLAVVIFGGKGGGQVVTIELAATAEPVAQPTATPEMTGLEAVSLAVPLSDSPLTPVLISEELCETDEETNEEPEETPGPVEEQDEEPEEEPEETPEPTPTPKATDRVNRLMRKITDAMGEERPEDVPELMLELELLDPGRAADIEFLIDYWQQTEEEGFIGGTRLPEGLPNDNSLCLVVFGYQLTAKGSMKPELIGRLEVALECAKQYPNAYILVTGGGTAANNKDATEAGKMARWLKQNGIDAERIIIENDSTTTGENIKYSYTMLAKRYPEVKSVVVITTDYHVRRCCIFFMARFLMKRSPLRVVANAAYSTGVPYVPESPKTIWYGVYRLYAT